MKCLVKVSLKVSVPFCITMRMRVHDRADPSSTHAAAAAAADNDDDDASWSRDNWPPITAQYEH